MQQDLNNVNPANSQNNPSNAPTIVQTDVGAKDGQEKCPQCGEERLKRNHVCPNCGYRGK